MELIENRMVNNAVWPVVPMEVSVMTNSPGYKELDTGIFVPEEDAYDYALERISQDEELKRDMVEWFYSGNWIKEENGTDQNCCVRDH